MPITSQFFGIIVSLYFDGEKTKHHLQHLHVRYNEYKAIYDFDGKLIKGTLPSKQSRLVEAWIIIHKEDLITLWNFMQEEGSYYKIKPL